MRRSIAARAGLVAALAVSFTALVGSPSGAAIGVTPLSAILPPGVASASFTVTNPETVERVVQPAVVRFGSTSSANDPQTKSWDWISVIPPFASIPPLGSRVIRMALRHRVTTSAEVSYRLVLNEVNSNEAGGVGFVVSTKISVPILPRTRRRHEKAPGVVSRARRRPSDRRNAEKYDGRSRARHEVRAPRSVW